MSKKIIGWREMVYFPRIIGHPVKAKIDTGARTTALHAVNIDYEKKGKTTWVVFDVHPMQDNSKNSKRVRAKLVDERTIKSSVGVETYRPVVELEIDIGQERFITEVTLVDRDMMGFRLLIGRQTLKGRHIVDVSKSFLTRTKNAKKIRVVK